MSLRSVHFVMPGGVDDASAPSGGNAYDRRLCLDLPGFGWQVHKHAVAGGWPRPSASARTELARTLSEFPDDSVVLLDGLVACGVPEIIAPRPNGCVSPSWCTCRSATRPGSRPPWPPSWTRRNGRRCGPCPPSSPPATGPSAGSSPTTGSPRNGSMSPPRAPTSRPRLRHRRRLPAAVRRRGHPAQGPAPADRGPRHRHRPALELRLRRRTHPGPDVRRPAARTDREVRARRPAAPRGTAGGRGTRRELRGGRPHGPHLLRRDVRHGRHRGARARDPGAGDRRGRSPRGGRARARRRGPRHPRTPENPAALAAELRGWFGEADVRRRLKAAARSRRAALDGWATTARSLAGVLGRLPQQPRRAA